MGHIQLFTAPEALLISLHNGAAVGETYIAHKVNGRFVDRPQNKRKSFGVSTSKLEDNIKMDLRKQD
jgi:hypothetical protein